MKPQRQVEVQQVEVQFDCLKTIVTIILVGKENNYANILLQIEVSI